MSSSPPRSPLDEVGLGEHDGDNYLHNNNVFEGDDGGDDGGQYYDANNPDADADPDADGYDLPPASGVEGDAYYGNDDNGNDNNDDRALMNGGGGGGASFDPDVDADAAADAQATAAADGDADADTDAEFEAESNPEAEAAAAAAIAAAAAATAAAAAPAPAASSASPSPSPSHSKPAPMPAASPSSSSFSATSSSSSSSSSTLDSDAAMTATSSSFPASFVYPDDASELSRHPRVFELPPEHLQLHRSFGLECHRRANLHYIDVGVLLFAVGHTVQTLDLFTGKQEIVFGHDQSPGAGVGAVAVHPSKQYFAVAETGSRPNIYIYSWPALQVVRILRGGTELAFTSVTFSPSGSKLASVGAAPDYSLVLWDWANERVTLRTKAFSQDVFRVQFSPRNEARLQTSGQGHIRFWQMSRTFTGLKLQGAIGKFGAVELSDIAAFTELPDGKVVSGTERGSLLVWDGGLVQLQLQRADGRPCHAGAIEFVELRGREVLTAGDDGYLRTWPLDTFEFAEAASEDLILAVEPTEEIFLGPDVAVGAMLRGDDHWVILNKRGGLFRLPLLAGSRPEPLLTVHAGPITGLAASPFAHTAVTAGSDGTVRCWDVHGGRQLFARKFPVAATAQAWAPPSVAHTLSPDAPPAALSAADAATAGGNLVAVGFADGVVRILARTSSGFVLRAAARPHSGPVVGFAFAPDGSQLATAGADGTVFFFEVLAGGSALAPIGFIQTAPGAGTTVPTTTSSGSAASGSSGSSGSGSGSGSGDAAAAAASAATSAAAQAQQPPIVSLQWAPDSQHVLFARGPLVFQVARPLPHAYPPEAARETYLISLATRTMRPQVPALCRLPPDEEAEAAAAAAAAEAAAASADGGDASAAAAAAAAAAASSAAVQEELLPDTRADAVSCLMYVRHPPAPAHGSAVPAVPAPGQWPFYCAFDDASMHVEDSNNADSSGASAGAVVAKASADNAGSGGDDEVFTGAQAGHVVRGPVPGSVLVAPWAKYQALHEYQWTAGAGVGAASTVAAAAAATAAAASGSGAGAAEPARSLPLGPGVGPVTALNYSARGSLLLAGTAHGSVQIRPVADIQFFFHSHLHSGHGGAVRALASTFDERFILSAGADGNFFAVLHDVALALRMADREHAVALLAAASAPAVAQEVERGKHLAALEARAARQRELAAAREAAAQGDVSLMQRYHAAVAVPLPAPVGDDDAAGGDGGVGAGERDVPEVLGNYSLEQAKQQQEVDERVALADKKKEYVRREIDELRAEFAYLLKQNALLEPSQRLARSSFELDPRLRQQFEHEAAVKVEEVQRELAWESEKHAVALAKLRARFLAPIQVECVRLRAFRSGMTVSTYRTPALPAFLTAAIKQVRALLAEPDANGAANGEAALSAAAAGGDDAEAAAAAATAAGGAADPLRLLQTVRAIADGASASSAALAGAGIASASATTGGAGGPASKTGAGGSGAGWDAAQRRAEREQRRQQLQLLRAARPDRLAHNAADMAAIVFAEQHLGDYALKADPALKVPEARRATVTNKRRQMVLLQEAVHMLKMEMNERVLALRRIKAALTTQLRADGTRVRELNAALGIAEPVFVPTTDPAEWPEHRDRSTDADLEKFAQWQAEQEALRVQRAREDNAKMTPQDLYGGMSDAPAAPTVTNASAASAAAAMVAVGATAGAGAQPSLASAAAERALLLQERRDLHAERLALVPRSAMEASQEAQRLRLLADERRELTARMDLAVAAFDDAVLRLRVEKSKLDTDVKSTELRLITLYEELILLRDCAEQEGVLTARLTKATALKAQVIADLAMCERALNGKLADVEACAARDRQLSAEFELVAKGADAAAASAAGTVVADGKMSELYAQLLRAYMRRVRRKRGQDDDGPASSSSRGRDAYSDDDEDMESGDDSDLSDDEDGGCPPGCDAAAFEKVLELRARRLEQDTIREGLRRQIGELEKTYERHQTRERAVDRDLDVVRADIDAFQGEKQQALNQVQVTLPLRLSQICNLVPEESDPAAAAAASGYNGAESGAGATGRLVLPSTLSSSVVFTVSGLRRLRHRISELDEEQAALSVQIKELKRARRTLMKDIEQKKAQITAEKQHCEDVQRLKFGQVIDLSVLATVGEDEAAVGLRSKLRSMEEAASRKLHEWDNRVQAAKDDLTSVTAKNTRLLEQVAKLTRAQYALETQLNKTTKNVHVTDASPADEQAEAERRELLHLVQLQEKEIDALKAEVHVLKRKGGRVYIPQ